MRNLTRYALIAAFLALFVGLLVIGCSDDDKADNPTIPPSLKGEWATLGTGIGVNTGGRVFALTTYDTKLIMGGLFTSVDSVAANSIAAWDGTSWAPLDGGVTGGAVKAFATWQNYLAVGGAFTNAGGSSADHVVFWNGSSFYVIDPGRAQAVNALADFTDLLFVGGDNGTGGGLATITPVGWLELATDITVNAFTVYDDALIIGGAFNDVEGQSYNNIFGFTVSNALSLGGGANGPVYALSVYKSMLIAGGYFSTAGGVDVHNIAAWDGSEWSPLVGGINGTVYGLTVFNNYLIAGGSFTTAGGVSANYIAAWDGSSWKALGSGMDGMVSVVTSYDNKIIAGGDFNKAGGVSAPGIAAWIPE
jgi:hypothetical protein